ncbi:MAG: SH3 domain-containing protein [Lentisphaeria bacterium]|nr:SH3 domain-containing protein [Lentisphaeria bacterium]
MLPLLALVLIVVLVFWAAPLAVARWQAAHRQTDEPGLATQALRYGEQTRVVLEPVADVFSRPDLKADRITQVLYNEPVTLLPEGVLYGYAAVQLQDGVRGYMLSADLTVSRDSVEPAGFLYKAIVINAVKRVMSHARRGTLLVEVMMGTVLYVDYRGAGVSRVLLPDGASGWISDDGIVLLPSDSQIKQPYQPREAFCSTALTFLQATTLENGQSVRGISMAGIIRLSAAINGMDLPRTRQDLYMAGQAVTLQKSAETGLVELEDLQSGDLLVLADPHDLTEPADLAILIDAEQILYARPSQTAIRLMNLSQNEDIWRRIVAVRRLFP